MESGFLYPFRTPATFTASERAADGLPRDPARLAHVEAGDLDSTIHLNSTYVDMIDRAYTIRGCDRSAMSSLIIVMILPATAALIYALIYGYGEGPFILSVILAAMALGAPTGIFLITWPILRREYFTYTHYPIRFNRKTRMIHVFRHNGPGGVLSVPWEAAYFHIGRGTLHPFILDLRGHVMDGDTVVDTFAVGNFFNTEEGIRQFWKFIVVYMEQGPQALPKDMYIITSTSRNPLNQFVAVGRFCHIAARFPLTLLFRVLFPIRWLIMLSCKTPVWPPEIQAESAIAPDDPCVWGEPWYSGGVIKDAKAEWDAMAARKRRLNRN